MGAMYKRQVILSGELADLEFSHLQRREEHWAIVDLVGKGGHIRTVPVPDWVKASIDLWVAAADISAGRPFRCVCRAGNYWGDGVTERVVWLIVKNASKRKVIIALSADPDIRVQEEFEDKFPNILAIEIKGGTDISNAHNRAGEAEKSHRKAKKSVD
jgi:XcyI restriction endonuclease